LHRPNTEILMAAMQPAEYQALKAFFRVFSQRYFNLGGVPARQRPLAVLETTERDAPDRAASELRMGINNCVEMSSHWFPAQVAALDAELKSQGIYSLSQVRQRYWGRYAAVLKRGRIQTEMEYHVVQGVLADSELVLADGERDKLAALSSAYRR